MDESNQNRLLVVQLRPPLLDTGRLRGGSGRPTLPAEGSKEGLGATLRPGATSRGPWPATNRGLSAQLRASTGVGVRLCQDTG